MGMIAFYAGLFVGVLFGCLFSSLWAFSLAGRKDGTQPARPRDDPRGDLLEFEGGQPTSPSPEAAQVGARG
jgi:hypothetical protein